MLGAAKNDKHSNSNANNNDMMMNSGGSLVTFSSLDNLMVPLYYKGPPIE